MSLASRLTDPIVRPLARSLTAGGGGGSAFSPASLFASGERGFIYDFSDPTKLFQNSNATGAVSAASDPIGYVTDLSGNANHGTQATGGTRPLYAAGGGAVGNGAKSMSCGTLDFSASSKLTVIVCLKTALSSNQGVFEHGSFSNGDASVLMNSGLGTYAASVYGAVANPAYTNTRGTSGAVFRVFTTEMDRAGVTAAQQVNARVNGELSGNSVLTGTATTTPLFASRAAQIMQWFGGTGLDGTMARIIVINRKLTVTELFNAERWCGLAGGLSLISEIPPAGQSALQMLDTYGQSLSVGAVPPATPISTSTRFAGDVMFQTNLKTAVPGFNFSSLIALVETTETLSGVPLAETPIAGMSEILHERPAYSGFTIGMATGFPSLTIAQLSIGQSAYNNRLAAISAAFRRGREQFKQTKMLAFCWLQGESDGANNTYAANLNTLRNDINTDVKAITLQTDNLWCLSYQLDRAKIGLAHLQAQQDYSNIVVAAPIYQLARNADNVHFTSIGSKVMGAYFGLAYERVVLGADPSWRPLMCTSVSVASAVADLTYNKSGLTLDTTIVPSQTNSGFRLVDSGGSALTISSVALLGSNQVRITAAAPIPAGAKVYYGFADPTNHTEGVDKGNLRDSQGSTIVFNGGGLDYAMHNWAVLQLVQLP